MIADFRRRAGQSWNVVLVATFVFFAAATLSVRADEPIVWQTGPKLAKALKNSVSFDWSERPLRDGLTVLSRGTSVAIFLDRRVDAGALVTLKVDDLPLADALKEVALEIGGSVAILGPVVYLGPRGIAPRVQALAALRQAEAAKRGGRWQGAEQVDWPELAEPRALAQAIVKEVGLNFANPEAIPHDVWPAWEGPPLTAAQRAHAGALRFRSHV